MKFPAGFLFGSASSAHQIEGRNFGSDWHHFEKNAGNISDGSTAKIAADSWNKWKEDVELLKSTNQNAYRFSIEWAKVEPKEGQFSQKAIEHYRQQLQYLRANHITPVVTLFHYTLPLWLAQKGGMINGKAVYYFVRFAKKIAEELGSLIDLWTPLNEPNGYALQGYLTGEWAPGEKSLIKALWVYSNLIPCHNKVYSAIKQSNKSAIIGVAINIVDIEPIKSGPLLKLFTWVCKVVAHRFFLTMIMKKCDFIGVNHYLKLKIQLKKPFLIDDSKIRSDYNWGIYPDSLYNSIMEATRWKKPIYITENGVADQNDALRPDFIHSAFLQIKKAIDEGAPVLGYFHWSLLDNFEWSSGYSQKFGLFTIDRKPRPSAQVYADLIQKYSA